MHDSAILVFIPSLHNTAEGTRAQRRVGLWGKNKEFCGFDGAWRRIVMQMLPFSFPCFSIQFHASHNQTPLSSSSISSKWKRIISPSMVFLAYLTKLMEKLESPRPLAMLGSNRDGMTLQKKQTKEEKEGETEEKRYDFCLMSALHDKWGSASGIARSTL